ncbi:hypothetical protein M8C21_008096, partial [Ambrosia artemisiifolia]
SNCGSHLTTLMDIDDDTSRRRLAGSHQSHAMGREVRTSIFIRRGHTRRHNQYLGKRASENFVFLTVWLFCEIIYKVFDLKNYLMSCAIADKDARNASGDLGSEQAIGYLGNGGLVKAIPQWKIELANLQVGMTTMGVYVQILSKKGLVTKKVGKYGMRLNNHEPMTRLEMLKLMLWILVHKVHRLHSMIHVLKRHSYKLKSFKE